MIQILITFVMFFAHIIGFNSMLTNYAELQNCVARTIENIFNETNSLLFLSEAGDEFAFPEIIRNPYVIANVDGLKRPERFAKIFSNDENIVMHVKQIEDVPKFNNLLGIFSKWPQENTFCLLCKFRADQFATDNECGRKFKDYVIGDCNSTRKHKFPNVFRKYPNCNILYGNIESWMHFRELKETYVTFKFLQTIAYALNMSFSHYHDKINFIEGSYLAVFKSNNNKTYFSIKDTVVFYYEDMVWNVPPPKRISSLAVLKITFKPLLWLFVLLAFFATSTVWWLLEKVLKKESITCFEVFLGVYSITLLGLTQRVPNTWGLRYAYITYIIYAIHIQTAFTSNLIQILTVAQYEPYINSLQDLAESNLSILIRDDTFNWLNSVDTKSILHKKIYEKFVILTPIDFHEAILRKNLTNSSILWNYDLFNYYERRLNKTLHYFVDNSFSGTTKSSFSGYSIVNLWPAFNRAVSVLFEAGFVDSYVSIFQKRNIKYYHESGFMNMNENKAVITLGHMSSIFTIWILGLFLGFVAFVIEVLTKNL
ncbi:hypothetical protein FQR65_LT08698 [Abscondita terminalis]|nr:hypothetical protein FQR65_LT08698 [Abscondita terminalis]